MRCVKRTHCARRSRHHVRRGLCLLQCSCSRPLSPCTEAWAPLPTCACHCATRTCLAPPSRPHEHLPQFVESSADAATAHMHEQLDGYLAALKSLDDNPNTVKKDKAAWRKYWVPFTELFAVPKWRDNPPHLTPSIVKHACCARSCC
eukprot:6203364-Pleurochrysis_carterae.AAC.2